MTYFKEETPNFFISRTSFKCSSYKPVIIFRYHNLFNYSIIIHTGRKPVFYKDIDPNSLFFKFWISAMISNLIYEIQDPWISKIKSKESCGLM